ncbi:hypothetical protein DWG18_06880 [Lysobacter sp. TY2-98]|uniref:hypothetical protein n=1 Tax=Lysobacter sp. TY2-98 TaxID=2290922 RepID=UPI000E2092BE|nr:hypothetical protein [Lysobacter sp. TY2-98]AXK72031.1 hypothetical protein DWG18_06880 [Lysobacter sp. TY2-98]
MPRKKPPPQPLSIRYEFERPGPVTDIGWSKAEGDAFAQRLALRLGQAGLLPEGQWTDAFHITSQLMGEWCAEREEIVRLALRRSSASQKQAKGMRARIERDAPLTKKARILALPRTLSTEEVARRVKCSPGHVRDVRRAAGQ